VTTRLRIDLAYDGAGFHGFARQVDVVTVQGTLEGALTRVCGLVAGPPGRGGSALPVVDQRVATSCAGRTDAGVHALAQVVHVDVDAAWSPAAARVVSLASEAPERLRRRLDAVVGPEITVWSVAVVDPSFDARFSARERRYRYVLTDHDRVDPRGRRYRWDVGEALDVGAMHAAAQALVGEHDFASLCRRADGGHTRRRIDEVAVRRAEVAVGPDGIADGIHVTLRGPAFCHQQVRSVTGCLVEVGRGRRPVAWMGEVLRARDRRAAARVAPPGGLTLEAVAYPAPWPDAPAAP
jgi:tRNA pseudouridine38-40 synthase